MSKQGETRKRPEKINGVQVRMPKDYNFHSIGKDFSKYKEGKDYILRTDAVYEKYTLKDWYRLANKMINFDLVSRTYKWDEPEDEFTYFFDPEILDDSRYFPWKGFSTTDSSTSFQTSVGPKFAIQHSLNHFFMNPDHHVICGMRFEKFAHCDTVYSQDVFKTHKNPARGMKNQKAEELYPCFREWHDVTLSCTPRALSFLSELHYFKRMEDFFMTDVISKEINNFPNAFDTPKLADRTTLTY